jgi:DNA-binding MarR family transcriptional regulator
MATKTTLAQTVEDLNVALCACGNLRRANRVVTQFYVDAMRPTGLTPGQFTVLVLLSGGQPKSQTALAEALAMDRTTLFRNLRPLEEKQLISVNTTKPRGAKTLSLTDLGGEALEHALPLWQQAQDHMTSTLGQDRWAGLIDGLASAVQAAQHR